MNDILSKANTYQQAYHDVGRAHYIAANYYARLNQAFGIPVIIITAVVGTTIFATLNDSPDTKWKILAGLVSLAGAVLAALQTSLGFSETAQKHKGAGENYRAIQRCFETFQLKYAGAQEDQRPAALAEYEQLMQRLDEIPKKSPTVPDWCYNKAKKEAAAREKAAAPSPVKP
jgi:hypothetical protein